MLVTILQNPLVFALSLLVTLLVALLAITLTTC